jgi:hypothetical protein
VICPGGVGFETKSASGGRGAVLVANLTRPGLHGVSGRVLGIRLGLQFSKTDDKHVNANGEANFWSVLVSVLVSCLSRSTFETQAKD